MSRPIQAVVINWKRPEETCRCLASLRTALRTLDSDEQAIIVIDNESSNASVTRIRRTFPQVLLLPQAENLGFGRAANIGMRQALERGAEAILLLNNDATIAPDALTHLTAAVANRDDPAIVSAKVFLTAKPGVLWAVGGIFRNRRTINLGSDEYDHGQYDQATLDFVYGCAMLVRADIIHRVGLFDERFFAYYEDIDLCLRAKAVGYRVGLVPTAHAWHDGSRSTHDLPAFKLYHQARGRMLLFHKHLSPAEKPLFYLEESRYLIALTLRSIMERDVKGAIARLRGYRDGLRASRIPKAESHPENHAA